MRVMDNSISKLLGILIAITLIVMACNDRNFINPDHETAAPTTTVLEAPVQPKHIVKQEEEKSLTLK